MFFFKGFTATVILFIVDRSLVYGNCSHCHSLCLYTAPPHPDIILPVHQRMPSTYPLVSVMLCSLAGICLSHCYLVPFLFHLCRHPVVCIIGWLNKNKKKYYQKKKNLLRQLSIPVIQYNQGWSWVRVYGKIWAALGKVLSSLPCLGRHPPRSLALT